MAEKKYDSTVARIAGNLLSGLMATHPFTWDAIPPEAVEAAVKAARAIVAETKRTEPVSSEMLPCGRYPPDNCASVKSEGR